MHKDINVNVSGPAQASATYKTVVLKGNQSFASQVTEENTKYVIKWDFDLGGGSVTIPEGCILEFDGGSLGNGTVDIAGLVGIYGFTQNDSTVIFKRGDVQSVVKINGNILPSNAELYYANLHDVVLNLKYKPGTPSRFGAIGDGVHDDYHSLQAAIDSVSFDGGVVSLKTEDNDNKSHNYKITQSLRIVNDYTTSEYKHETSSLKEIVGDTNDKYTTNATTITCVGLKHLESALVLDGFNNVRNNHTFISSIRIVCPSDLNAETSYCLEIGASSDILVSSVVCEGVNGLLLSSMAAGASSYAFIQVRFDTCTFRTIGGASKPGFALASKFALGGNGTILLDNYSFDNCTFIGTALVSANVCNFKNCMWSTTSGNSDVKLSTLYPEHRLAEDYIIHFREAIITVTAFNLKFDSCFFEDCEYICDSLREYSSDDTNQHVVVFDNCFFNGFLNDGTKAKYIARNEAAFMNFRQCLIRVDYNYNQNGLAFTDFFFKTIDADTETHPYNKRAIISVDDCELMLYSSNINPDSKCIGRFDKIKFISITRGINSRSINVEKIGPNLSIGNNAAVVGKFSVQIRGLLYELVINTDINYSDIASLLSDDLKITCYIDKKAPSYKRTTFAFTRSDFININGKAGINKTLSREDILLFSLDEIYEITCSYTGTQASIWNNKQFTIYLCGTFRVKEEPYKTVGVTSERPTLNVGKVGFGYFDITLGKPIYWNGSNWVDATGATV